MTQLSSKERLDLPHGTCAALAKEINEEAGEHRVTAKIVWNKIHLQRDPQMLERVAAYVERVNREKALAERKVRRALKQTH